APLGVIGEGDANVEIEGDIAKITMTLTSQTCPEAQNIPEMMKRRVNTLEGIESTEVEVVWEPQWGPHCISDEGRKILGFEEE
ncbi:MAG: iron-sulfur cluster assembly protein, partial [Planctomycetota bacterium]|nr:iron-sulfur cluster assembly protein [Planctomycetota bacterium]